MTPTARTLNRLRRLGYVAAVSEKWVTIPARNAQPARKFRRDLFGIVDIVAIHPRMTGTLYVQSTTKGNLASRVCKAQEEATVAVRAMLAAGNKFEVWGWFELAGKWEVKIVTVRLKDLAAVVVANPKRRPKSRQRQGELF